MSVGEASAMSLGEASASTALYDEEGFPLMDKKPDDIPLAEA